MKAKFDLTGKKFGRLYVTNFHHKNEKARSNFWNCLCDCGKTVVVSASSLKRRTKPTMSCGCYRYDKISGIPARNRLDYGISNLRSLIWTYKKSAIKRDIEFNLTENLFRELTKNNCHYCNSLPTQKHSKRETYGYYIYNGIDRKDNNLGYTADNCISCCKICNYAKRDLSYEEFKCWIANAYYNFCKNNTT